MIKIERTSRLSIPFSSSIFDLRFPRNDSTDLIEPDERDKKVSSSTKRGIPIVTGSQ